MEFTQEEHRIWATLMARQVPRVQENACQEYLEGAELLALPGDRIPSLENLNRVLTPRTGWQAVRTTVRYSDAAPWYRAFAQRRFLVTDYLRAWDELEFTPEPDAFHDIFGHLPFMTLPRYTALQSSFASAFERADVIQRENIKRLAWYSTEFGLIRERGRLKVFGAGLISSSGEMDRVLSGAVPVQPFTVENVLAHPKSVWSYNESLFVIDSLELLQSELDSFFDSIPARGPLP